MKTLKHKFGDFVRVNNEVTFGLTTKVDGRHFRVFSRLNVDCVGIVVGGKFRRTGQVVHSSGYEEDYEQGYLADVKTVFVYEVKTGFINRTMEVLEEDLVPSISFELPRFKCDQPEWDESNREYQRTDVKDWPRDKKGRWLKFQTGVSK